MIAKSKSRKVSRSYLYEGLDEVVSHLRGESPLDAEAVVLPTQDVAAIRRKLSLSQSEFSATFRVPLASVKNWEQGRRELDASTNVLLYLIDHMPGEVAHCLQSQRSGRERV